MIEYFNIGFGAFVIALVIYSFFTDRPWIDLAVIPIGFVFLTYSVGYDLGTGEVYKALFSFLVLLGFTGIIIWRIKKAPEEREERTYSREELIIAKKIYDKNYLEDPEGFTETKGTYDDAQVSIDYLLGIIDGQGKPFKKEWNESKVARS